jgi:hypothetical protein
LIYKFGFIFFRGIAGKKCCHFVFLWVSLFVYVQKLLTTLWQIWEKVLEGFGKLLKNLLWGARGIGNALKNFLAGIGN